MPKTSVGGSQYPDGVFAAEYGWVDTLPPTDIRRFIGNGIVTNYSNVPVGTATKFTAEMRWEAYAPVVPTPTLYLDVHITVNRGFDDCDCKCVSTEKVGNGSVDFEIDLGADSLGRSGKLSCKSEFPDPSLCTPVGLAAVGSPDFEIIRWSGTSVSNGGYPRQVLAPSSLADIVIINSKKYEIRLYERSQVGAKVNGLYTLNAGATPSRTFVVENPDTAGSTFNKLNLTKTTSAGSTTYQYEYVANDLAWILTRPDNTVEYTTSVYNTGETERTLTRTFKSATGTVVKVEQEKFAKDAYNLWRKVEHRLDPDTLNLLTQYEYYNDTGATYCFGKLKSTQQWDGSWEKLEYATNGQVSKRVRPFENSTITDADTLQDVVTTSYSTLTGGWARETQVRSVLGQEVSRSYVDRLYSSGVLWKEKEIRAVAPGAADNAAGNLITERVYNTSGTFKDELASELRPDGTMTLITYTSLTGAVQKVTFEGQPNAGKTAIVNGTKTTEVVSLSGEITSQIVEDVTSSAVGITISSKVGSNPDAFGRIQRYDYADGTYETFDYACCGLATHVDRNQITTDYIRAFDGKVTTEVRQGVQTDLAYDAAGNLLSRIRSAMGSSPINVERYTYDLAGRCATSKDALDYVTSFSETVDTSGRLISTTTLPNTGTLIQTRNRDGQIAEVAGTAARPMKSQRGVEAESSVQRLYTKEIRIGSGGAETEWAKTYLDAFGRAYKVVYPDAASAATTYNSLGQLNKTTDPDGVATLYAYNAKGEQEVVALDMDRNGSIDYGGTDRIRKTVTTYVNDSGPKRLTTVQEWKTLNNSTASTVLEEKVALNGLSRTTVRDGLTTTASKTTPASGGSWTETQTLPDGSQLIRTYSGGRLASEQRKDATGAQIGNTSYGYDGHGRVSTTTDARNGQTSYTYTARDEVETVTTPAPSIGIPAQTTTYTYNNVGRRITEQLPDSSSKQYEYSLPGDLTRSYGSQTYDVSYTYDPQGRMKTMTTSGQAGSAVTTWNYSTDRGFLTSKVYPDSEGPVYTYTDAGRLETRTWQRGVVTTYSYDNAGQVNGIDYSDSTPDVTFTYHRCGQQDGRTDAAGAHAITMNAACQPLAETITGGLLGGVTVTNSYDSLLRRNGVSVTIGSNTITSQGFGYDDASRIATVTSGDLEVNYTRIANSELLDTTVFKKNGATTMTTDRNYDFVNRLLSISTTRPDTSVVSSTAYDYNSLNQRTKATKDDASYWDYGYNTSGEVTSGSRKWSDTTSVLGQQFGYAYDGIGNRTSTTTNGRTANYTNNNLNQITSRVVPGALDIAGMADPLASVTVNLLATQRQANGWFYKELAVDNSTAPQWQQVDIVATTPGAGPGGSDLVETQSGHLFLPQTPEQFTYDDDGNMLSDGRWNYTWDGENRLIQVETNVSVGPKKKITYAYDGLSRRIERKLYTWNAGLGDYDLTDTQRYIYDGWNILADVDGSLANPVKYVWGLDLSGSMQGAGGVGALLFRRDGSTEDAYAYDGNGNVVALTDAASGDLTGQYTYDPFGSPLEISGTNAEVNLYRFSTKRSDRDAGLLLYELRCYGPNSGRWLSRDPFWENGGTNLYSPANNDILNSIDPIGLFELGIGTGGDAGGQFFIHGLEVSYSAQITTNCRICITLTGTYIFGMGLGYHAGAGVSVGASSGDLSGPSNTLGVGIWAAGGEGGSVSAEANKQGVFTGAGRGELGAGGAFGIRHSFNCTGCAALSSPIEAAKKAWDCIFDHILGNAPAPPPPLGKAPTPPGLLGPAPIKPGPAPFKPGSKGLMPL